VIGRFRLFFTLSRILGLIVVLTIGLVAPMRPAMSIRERATNIAVMRLDSAFRSPRDSAASSSRIRFYPP